MAVGVAVTQPGFAPGVALVPGRWSAWADRVDGSPLGQIQLMSCRFDQKLSGFGTAEATISATESPIDHDDMLRLWSWRLWIAYEGTAIWCGLPSHLVDDTGAAVSLGFTELHGYLTKRAWDIVGGQRFNQVEQTEIARQIAQPVADVGCQISTEPGPGFLRDRFYEYLEGPYRSNLLENLSNVISGPEFRLELPNNVAVLRIAYPQVGSGQSSLGLFTPGDAIGPNLTYDSEKLRNRTFAVGDVPEGQPEDTPKPVAVITAEQLGLRDPLMPRLDGIDDWPSVILMETLTDRATTNATIYARPAIEVKGSVLESDPLIYSYGIGDDVTVRMNTPFNSLGVQTLGRLVERSVDCATGQVAWTVTIKQRPEPPTLSRPPITVQLGALANNQSAVFRRRLAPF